MGKRARVDTVGTWTCVCRYIRQDNLSVQVISWNIRLEVTMITHMKIRCQRIIYLSLLLSIMLLIPLPAAAVDLPIDINAIRSQGSMERQHTPHFGTNLFTPDSRRASEAVYAQFKQRQETSAYLFSAVAIAYEMEINEHIMNMAYNLALFATPTNFAHVSIPPPDAAISNSFIALVIATSVITGLILAFALKKKKQATDVH